jgi:hypothetical protein
MFEDFVMTLWDVLAMLGAFSFGFILRVVLK